MADTEETPVLDTLVFPFLAEDEALELPDEDWPTSGPPKGVRLRMPTLILLAVLIGVGGLWIGSVLQKGEGSAGGGAAASAFSRLRGLAGATGASGAGGLASLFGGAGRGGGAAGAGATDGTVTVIEGNTLYITEASGSLVKVNLTSATTITRNSSATSTDLRPGDTVVVTGATGSGGAVNATAVAATAQGVTTTRGGGGAGAFTGAGG